MNREKTLFLVVAAIALLWGGLAISSPFTPERRPKPQYLVEEVPEVKDLSSRPLGARFLGLAANVESLPPVHAGGGRTWAVPHTDLLPVEAAVLDFPRSLLTPWVLPPVSPFPDVPYFRWFRADEIPVVAGGGEAPIDTGVDPLEDEEEDEGPGEEEVLTAKQWEFVATEWDMLTLPAGIKWYGTISLKDAQKKQGFTKYQLLLPGNEDLPFYWEQIDTRTGKIPTTGTLTLNGSRIEQVTFADTIENRYWERRTVDRVKPDDAGALVSLAAWVMELAEEERYDRMTGLELAVTTYRQAVAAAAGNLDAILGLGEALHRAFRFEEELDLYRTSIEAKPRPALYKRLARLFETLSLPGKAEEALTVAVEMAAGDTEARIRRAEVRYALGRVPAAQTDFTEAGKIGSPEEKAHALEGRARCLLAAGKPAEAASLLASADDPDSLVTRGAALYAQSKWSEALDCFQRAVDAAPDHAEALTNLGFALAWVATDEAGVQAAVDTLDRARAADALNYFRPPLGAGFAEQRRGKRVDSVDRYSTASLALPTDPYVHYVLGRSYLRDGRFGDAREEFREALRLDYRFADALIGAGTASLSMADFASAREELARAVTLEARALEQSRYDPARQRTALISLARARYRLARAWLLSGDVTGAERWDAAEAELRAILDADDTFAPAINALAYLTYQRGDPEGALDGFDRARNLAPDTPEGVLDRGYAEECKRRILDFLSRRRWVDNFDRPDGQDIGNAWKTTKVGTIGPRILEGKVDISGRATTRGGIWLSHDDPVPGGSKLGRRFIRVRAAASVGRTDRIEFQFMAYTMDKDGKPQAMIAIGRNPLGQVVVTSQKSADRDRTEELLKDASGNPVAWPEGEVELGIVRIDPDKGVFAVSLNGERVGTPVELGIRRNRDTALWIGFLVTLTPGESFGVKIDDVEMELYYTD